jgi:hypothetical protein
MNRIDKICSNHQVDVDVDVDVDVIGTWKLVTTWKAP